MSSPNNNLPYNHMYNSMIYNLMNNSVWDKKDFNQFRDMMTKHKQNLQIIHDEYSRIISSLKDYKWYSGYGNNILNKEWGSVGSLILRKVPSQYGDMISSPSVRGQLNPNPRVVSNRICRQTVSIKNEQNLSDYLWLWGQFLDHEITLTPTGSQETISIQTSDLDPYETYNNPPRTINFSRSSFAEGVSPREHFNQICSYINGGAVYGTSKERVDALRMHDGSGKMKVSMSNNGEILLGKNLFDLDNVQEPPNLPKADFFVAGDVRANENIFLCAIHTLFVREHNRLCDIISKEFSPLKGHDELIFQKAKRLVVAAMQKITYEDFLPLLLGENGIPKYSGYDENINSTICTEFSTVGYRFGHTLLSSELQIDDKKSTLLLRNCFFNPAYIQENGIDNLLYGASVGIAEKMDGKVVDDIRNHLFGPPTHSHLLDLATLNIQRGRDHGIPDYNTLRETYGLQRFTNWVQISDDPEIVQSLEELYGDINAIDPWIGCLVENHFNGLPISELLFHILRDQFIRIRDGDRFWYQNQQYTVWETKYLETVSLAQIIRDNTRWKNMRQDPFHSM